MLQPRTSVTIGSLILLVGGVWAFQFPSQWTATQITSASIYVIDGDTIDNSSEKVRLIGLDAPETHRAECMAEQALGDKATYRLRALIDGAETLELVEQKKRDKYDRLLAKLIVDGEDVARTLISEGLARSYEGGKRLSWCE